MRRFVFIAMLIGWLGYLVMPAMAAPPAGVTAVVETAMASGEKMVMHHRSGADSFHSGTNRSSVPNDCPGCPGMMHTAFCPGCIATLPGDYAAPAFHDPFRYPKPQSDRFRIALDVAPMTPPPRS